jgi:hypothetical protein
VATRSRGRLQLRQGPLAPGGKKGVRHDPNCKGDARPSTSPGAGGSAVAPLQILRSQRHAGTSAVGGNTDTLHFGKMKCERLCEEEKKPGGNRGPTCA